MFAFKTLQRRLIVLLVVPVTLFLLVIGVFGYRFIQGLLFKDWQEIAILRLERAAHQMDMRLHGQMQWMETFARAGQDARGQEIQRWLFQQIKSQPGVRQVNLTWKKAPVDQGPQDCAAPIRRNVSHRVLLPVGCEKPWGCGENFWTRSVSPWAGSRWS